jgi:hypothetical protein
MIRNHLNNPKTSIRIKPRTGIGLPLCQAIDP